MAEKIEDLDLLKTLHFNFARIYEKKGMFQFALEEYKLYEEIKDTIMNKEQQKVLTEMEIKFDSEEKERENEILRKEKELTIAEKKQAQLEQQKAEEEKEKRGYMLGAGFILLVGVGFISLVLYRSNRQKTRTNRIIKLQKEQVEVQRDLVSEKNKEILDSIEYAKRLQDAILPPQRLVKEYLPNSFVLYKPKDIVAGDFYFMEPVEDMVYYAAADCTGHGVPGAMVSVICSNAMNKAILEEGLRDPGEILNRVKELVIDRFERSEETVYDGMDVALVKLPKDLLPDDSDSLDIEFAGANNPLWIVRSGGNEVEEYRGDPVPIGRFAVDEEFSTHRVSLQKDDCAYVFSDGYADQFGGEKGKKFKSRNFKKLLSDIHSLPMQEQRNRLNNTFEKWRGEIEQIDDVCVIGLRV